MSASRARKGPTPIAQAAPPAPWRFRAPSAVFAVGDDVVVTDGQSVGAKGRVAARWADFRTEPQWVVDLPDCAGRVIRQDFLAKQEG